MGATLMRPDNRGVKAWAPAFVSQVGYLPVVAELESHLTSLGLWLLQ